MPAGWRCAGRTLDLRPRPLLMGILNVTPDSFSDGGRYPTLDAAVAQALAMEADGADILDVGGESTRPGSEPVSEEEERARVVPVIEAVRRQSSMTISIDTTKAGVARAALEAGAQIVNDVSACTADADMVHVVRVHGAGLVLMHMLGTPRTMQRDPRYADVVGEVGDALAARVQALADAGVSPDCMAVDPGIGFGKTAEHNTRLLGRLDALVALGRPVVVGLSRKSMVGALTGRPPGQRLAGSLAGLAWSVAHGAAVLRVHDVAASRDALLVTMALMNQATGA